MNTPSVERAQSPSNINLTKASTEHSSKVGKTAQDSLTSLKTTPNKSSYCGIFQWFVDFFKWLFCCGSKKAIQKTTALELLTLTPNQIVAIINGELKHPSYDANKIFHHIIDLILYHPNEVVNYRLKFLQEDVEEEFDKDKALYSILGLIFKCSVIENMTNEIAAEAAKECDADEEMLKKKYGTEKFELYDKVMNVLKEDSFSFTDAFFETDKKIGLDFNTLFKTAKVLHKNFTQDELEKLPFLASILAKIYPYSFGDFMKIKEAEARFEKEAASLGFELYSQALVMDNLEETE